jgi:hypothetical protein
MSASLITGVVAGVLAVAATVMGGLLTSRTSAQSQRRGAQFAREEVYLRELRIAITEFCTAIMIYRGAELDHWEANHGGTYELQPTKARMLETRTTARDAQYRVELSTRSDAIGKAARAAFVVAKSIKDAETEAEVRIQRKRVEKKLSAVIALARQAIDVRDL